MKRLSFLLGPQTGRNIDASAGKVVALDYSNPVGRNIGFTR